jgi:hypothetical protein
MTSTKGAASPACRQIRQLLGVYVVGAIDPAERVIVDSHLETCPACQAELAGLAGLPALLGRVPLADAERITDAERMGDDGYWAPTMVEPSPELLSGLLGRVAARRRSRRWRAVLTLAAAVAIAAGGTAAAVNALQPGSGPEVVQASNAGLTAKVSYSATPWHGTAYQVAVLGIPPGTKCQFWVVDAAGHRSEAASWKVGPGYGEKWYSVSSPIAASSVRDFEITSAGKTLISIPAS